MCNRYKQHGVRSRLNPDNYYDGQFEAVRFFGIRIKILVAVCVILIVESFKCFGFLANTKNLGFCVGCLLTVGSLLIHVVITGIIPQLEHICVLLF
mmetsp:Transcript_25376/g.37371  ORF Transcript_25376/g.37371 Transcript_25376/m.37371 type:complete len:96 (+) Transcript_25376:1323-1610(+)